MSLTMPEQDWNLQRILPCTSVEMVLFLFCFYMQNENKHACSRHTIISNMNRILDFHITTSHCINQIGHWYVCNLRYTSYHADEVWVLKLCFNILQIVSSAAKGLHIGVENGIDPALTLIPAWINDDINYKIWNEIMYPLPNLDGATFARNFLNRQKSRHKGSFRTESCPNFVSETACRSPRATNPTSLQYIPRNMHTVLLCFALLWLCNRSSWIHMKYLSIFIRVALLALGQSLDCHSASEVSLMDMGKSVNV